MTSPNSDVLFEEGDDRRGHSVDTKCCRHEGKGFCALALEGMLLWRTLWLPLLGRSGGWICAMERVGFGVLCVFYYGTRTESASSGKGRSRLFDMIRFVDTAV